MIEPDRRSISQRLRAMLQDTELRLWHLIVAFVCTSLVSYFIAHWDEKRDLIVERSGELVVVSSDFENNVNALVASAATFSDIEPDAVAALYVNVEQQISALNRIRPILSGDDQRELADKYADVLVEVRNLLQDGLLVNETRSFGAAAQDLVTTRDRFLGTLS